MGGLIECRIEPYIIGGPSCGRFTRFNTMVPTCHPMYRTSLRKKKTSDYNKQLFNILNRPKKNLLNSTFFASQDVINVEFFKCFAMHKYMWEMRTSETFMEHTYSFYILLQLQKKMLASNVPKS